MSSIDTLSGGSIEPRGLEEEMQSSYLDYAMSVIVGRALPQVRERRWRRDGQLPPARRPGDLRHAGPPRPGLRAALPARGQAGELRLDRQRSAGGHALHRGAAPRSARPE